MKTMLFLLLCVLSLMVGGPAAGQEVLLQSTKTLDHRAVVRVYNPSQSHAAKVSWEGELQGVVAPQSSRTITIIREHLDSLAMLRLEARYYEEGCDIPCDMCETSFTLFLMDKEVSEALTWRLDAPYARLGQ
ncbi:MAG: hypothetical protein R3B52_02130 [Candidatus Paceibacterota bacterium]